MKNFRQYINYKLVPGKNAHVDKLPLSPKTGQVCNAHDSGNWCSKKEAEEAGGLIAFVFTADDPYFFIDIDNAYGPDGWSQTAMDLCRNFAGCYIEVSQSHAGLHIFGRIPEDLPHSSRNRAHGLEFYTSGRFVALTGTNATGDAGFMPDVGVYAQFINQYFPPSTGSPGAHETEWTDTPCSGWNGPESDTELISRMLQSKSAGALLGGKASFRQLWEADPDALGAIWPDAGGQMRAFDWSSADASLCSHLAFFTGKDCSRIERLWGQSALGGRDKWGREDYRRATILNAVAGCKNVYRQPGTTPAETAATGLKVLTVQELNEKHGAVMVGGKFRVLNIGDGDFTLSSVQDFESRYRNTSGVDPYSTNETGGTAAKIWLKSPNRREYDGIVFEPGKTTPNHYNLWQGLSMDPEPSGDWSLFRDHLKDVISGGDADIAQWITAWLARIVQDPGGDRPGTAIVLRGSQGTGKGVFVNIFGKILGKHFLQIAQPGQVTGRFNNHFADCLLSFIDEGFWAGNRHAEGVLKNLITEPWLTIEKKGQDLIRVKNHCNFIFASNDSWVVPAGLEERRFFVLDVSDIHRQDGAYFNALVNQMKNGGVEAMLHDLLKMDISKVDLRKFKQTAALFDQKLASMTTIQAFWFELLSEGILPGQTKWGEVQTNDLHAYYQVFCNSANERRQDAPQQFGRGLQKLCSGMKKARPRQGKQRQYVYYFPTLADCRAEFESRLGGGINWDEL